MYKLSLGETIYMSICSIVIFTILSLTAANAENYHIGKIVHPTYDSKYENIEKLSYFGYNDDVIYVEHGNYLYEISTGLVVNEGDNVIFQIKDSSNYTGVLVIENFIIVFIAIWFLTFVPFFKVTSKMNRRVKETGDIVNTKWYYISWILQFSLFPLLELYSSYHLVLLILNIVTG